MIMFSLKIFSYLIKNKLLNQKKLSQKLTGHSASKTQGDDHVLKFDWAIHGEQVSKR